MLFNPAKSCETALPECGFLDKAATYGIQRRQSVFERRTRGPDFDKWGCRMCGRKKVSHASSGHCGRSHNKLTLRLMQLKREYNNANPERDIERDIDRLSSRFRSAEKLLGEG